MLSFVAEVVYRNLIKQLSLSKATIPSRLLVGVGHGLRKGILKFYDPVVKIQIQQKVLYMNLSHQLPLHMAANPCYDTALPRICVFLKETLGYLNLIDVGANIGDTTSLVSQKVRGNFLCIEADENYFSLLQKNIKAIQNSEKLVCVRVLCGESSGDSHISFVRSKGSGHVCSEPTINDKIRVRQSSIDDLIEEHTDFQQCNIMKVDTDGYDYRVIRGSDTLLKKAHPALFFELSPEYLFNAGETPMSIFDYLSERGYGAAVWYDNFGIPIAKVNFSDREYMSQLINYATNKRSYFDLLTFHDSMRAHLDLFHTKEMKLFSKMPIVSCGNDSHCENIK
jgi:FkbM family methyltransferase